MWQNIEKETKVGFQRQETGDGRRSRERSGQIEAHTQVVWARFYVLERISREKHTSLSYHTSQPHKR